MTIKAVACDSYGLSSAIGEYSYVFTNTGIRLSSTYVISSGGSTEESETEILDEVPEEINEEDWEDVTTGALGENPIDDTSNPVSLWSWLILIVIASSFTYLIYTQYSHTRKR
jgi:hypothetical protein